MFIGDFQDASMLFFFPASLCILGEWSLGSLTVRMQTQKPPRCSPCGQSLAFFSSSKQQSHANPVRVCSCSSKIVTMSAISHGHCSSLCLMFLFVSITSVICDVDAGARHPSAGGAHHIISMGPPQWWCACLDCKGRMQEYLHGTNRE